MEIFTVANTISTVLRIKKHEISITNPNKISLNCTLGLVNGCCVSSWLCLFSIQDINSNIDLKQSVSFRYAIVLCATIINFIFNFEQNSNNNGSIIINMFRLVRVQLQNGTHEKEKNENVIQVCLSRTPN